MSEPRTLNPVTFYSDKPFAFAGKLSKNMAAKVAPVADEVVAVTDEVVAVADEVVAVDEAATAAPSPATSPAPVAPKTPKKSRPTNPGSEAIELT